MNAIEKLNKALRKDFGFEGAEGSIKFNLKDYQPLLLT